MEDPGSCSAAGRQVADASGAEACAGSALASLAASMGDAELRPALLHTLSRETVDCYTRRLRHYAAWCTTAGFQPGAAAVTTEKLVEYVREQIRQQQLRPSTVRQAINALIHYAERAAGTAPDSREAKELVRWYDEACRADGHPPAYRVPGRRSPREPRTSRTFTGGR